MSFYITIKSLNLNNQHQNNNGKVSIVVTSPNHRLVCTFVNLGEHILWEDAFVAGSNERQLQFMLIQQIVPGKTAKKLRSNHINMSKYLFQSISQKDQIHLHETFTKSRDILTIQVSYVEQKNFIGEIEFYRKGGSNEFQEDQFLDMKIQGDNTLFPFWRRGYIGGKQEQSTEANILDGTIEKEQVKFYKGAHKNRNIFSLCDQVFDDQKFTVIQNYYTDQ